MGAWSAPLLLRSRSIREATTPPELAPSQPSRRGPGAGTTAGGNSKLRSGPEVFVCHGLGREQPAREVLLDSCPAQQCGPEAGSTKKPAHEERCSPHDASCDRYPAKQCPRRPEAGDGKQSDEKVAVAVGGSNDHTERHTPASVRLTQRMRHGQVPAHYPNHHEHREHGNREGQQENPGN